MKLKTIYLVLMIIFQTNIIFSQFNPCLFDIGMQKLDSIFPGYLQHSIRNIEYYKNVESSSRVDVLKINVVFHIVYKEDEENISDSFLHEQIDVLNTCFRRRNADTINLRSIFKHVVGDAGIEFNLKDVIRVKTDKLFTPSFSVLPDDVKLSNKGGSDAVAPKNNLNIWICRLQPIEFFGTSSPLLGYAYPPDSLAHWPSGSSAPSAFVDGVVLDFRTVSTDTFHIKDFKSIPMLGKTCVHEVAHYLGLRHISGDAGIFGANCSGSDGIDDTPKQSKQSEFDCNNNQNTCDQNIVNDHPDMIENYMDYSSESCQNSFTKEQIKVMRGVLMTHRNGLISGGPSIVTKTNRDILIFNNITDGIYEIPVSLENPKLYNSTGHCLHINIQSNNILDIQHLESGVYFLVSNNYHTAKIVKL